MKEVASKQNLLKWLSGSLLLFVVVVGLSPIASAEEGDGTVELMLGFGFAPDDPDFKFDTAFGPGVGLGYEFSDGIQLRTDVSYFKWDDSATACDIFGACDSLSLELRNIPVFVGGRFFAPLTERLHLFAELGLSINFLEVSLTDTASGIKGSDSQTKLGLVPGLGIEFQLSEEFSVGANVRYNLIAKGVGDFDEGTTSFLSAAALLGYHF